MLENFVLTQSHRTLIETEMKSHYTVDSPKWKANTAGRERITDELGGENTKATQSFPSMNELLTHELFEPYENVGEIPGQ